MKTWQDCVAFHGHECGGLTIGYKASLYAIELLNLEFSDDEQVVCIAGKQAFSFYNRKTGKSVRLVLKPKPEGMTREESFAYYQACKPAQMFDVKEATICLPEKARLFDSYTCNCCGETTGANWVRLVGDQTLCLDCYDNYDRFHI